MFVTLKFSKLIGACGVFLGVLLLVFWCNNFIKDKAINVSADVFREEYIIVVDAGHGYPDGGATSVSGINESDINLGVAKLLEKELVRLGYEVIMTRTDENNIADDDKQNTVRKMKVSDINNRIEIVNNSNADMLVSIHMNKFSEEKYYGWQTFYKKGSELSKVLANKIQNKISNNIDRENKRTELPIDNVKLIDKSLIPSVIVECGFLSNHEDVRLLQTEEYKMQIVNGIVEGIEEFYNINK